MESSEEDAGAASNASRRASARERDVGEAEDVAGVPQHPAEPGAASGAASSAEEAYDADSVPSPSQYANTSTEALLDMIDEIVDGPDALRRRSRTSTDVEVDGIRSDTERPPAEPDFPTASSPSPTLATSATSETISLNTDTLTTTECKPYTEPPTSDFCVEKVSPELVNNASEESNSAPPTGEVILQESLQGSSNTAQDEMLKESKILSEIVPVQKEILQEKCPVESNADQIVCDLPSELQQECSNKVEVPQDRSTIEKPENESEVIRQIESPQASSSIPYNELAVSTPNDTPSSDKCGLPSSLSPNVPSSSVTGNVSNILDSSEIQTSERTLKCVTSSDSRDDVTVESAESTSSEISVRENQAAVSETRIRSPLRRRLVRPAPSDRRPDSTVSSSVDSETHVDTTEQATSERVTKDVSSSSDAVSSVYCNVKPEEIRNVSEISVCKAETSMSPPKKIKLVRQRISQTTSQKDLRPEIAPEKEQCQSTSSECAPASFGSIQNVTVHENLQSNYENQGSSKDQCILPVTSTPIVTSESAKQEAIAQLEPQCLVPIPTIPEMQEKIEEQNRTVPSIKLNLTMPETSTSVMKTDQQGSEGANVNCEVGESMCEIQELPESSKQVPKLTIKLGNKQPEEPKSSIPKLTIKPIRPPAEIGESIKDLQTDQKASITKLNIKPIPKPAEKINDMHRKSSSSEISESESSENDESNSMSDQASNSDNGPPDVVPKVTIKVGKPGTESEGKFYTEQNLTKQSKNSQESENLEQESVLRNKIKVIQQDETQMEKIPKLTIKTVSKSEGQPLSPKLTIKPLKPPENVKKEISESTETAQIPKLKISTESLSSNVEIKENTHIPKITIKTVLKTDESTSKASKKSTVVCDSPEHIPVVTKLNIKPVLKPAEEDIGNADEKVPIISKLNIKPIVKPIDSTEDISEDSEGQVPVISRLNIKPIVKPSDYVEKFEAIQDIKIVSKLNIKPILKPVESEQACKSVDEKVPVVSKINIKPIIKPKEDEVKCDLETIPKVSKLNIKPIRNPDAECFQTKDCDVLNADMESNSIPVVTKINIKPIVKPVDEDAAKDSENQSSETGNSSDDNGEHIPVVTKINIKPIIKPSETEDSSKSNLSHEENIPVVTKLNIKPLVKPEESKSPSSPKKENLKITKLNIKPIVKPEELVTEDVATKNPPLVMKINIKDVSSEASDDSKINNIDDSKEHLLNNSEESIPKIPKLNIKPIVDPDESKRISVESVQINCKQDSSQPIQTEVSKVNCVPEPKKETPVEHASEQAHNLFNEKTIASAHTIASMQATSTHDMMQTHVTEINKTNDKLLHSESRKIVEHKVNQSPNRAQSSLQNCTLLKKLLETKTDGLDKRLEDSKVNSNHSALKTETNVLIVNHEQQKTSNSELSEEVSKDHENDLTGRNLRDNTVKESIDNLSKPLEIAISDKISNQSSGQDSPRIIIKINKTDHGPSAKIITEERPATPQQNDVIENTQEIVNDKQSQKKVVNSRKKSLPTTPSLTMGKRLRSSRIVEEKSPSIKRTPGKRPPSTDTSPTENKEHELSVLESKRLKLGQLLSNKTLSNPPANTKPEQVSPTKQSTNLKMTNHSLLNNENCSKNGNSKLHNILSNLHAKQAQALALQDVSVTEKTSITPDLESNASTGSSDVVEVIIPIENSHAENQIVISESSESRDLPATMDESARDPLEVEAPRETPVEPETPTPKRRGRPRKVPVATPVPIPVAALQERPQRSLRLSRERATPPTLAKGRGRGRGRGRGARRAAESPRAEASPEPAAAGAKDEEDPDPTSSRVKLPRMTEALDKLPQTPLSSRRRSSGAEAESKVVLDPLPEAALRSPETPRRGRGGRGSRGRGRGAPLTPRTPRGRGRGGGRGATYMKETMGIYGRVCGPATTTVVEIFEEETCMMDDNATSAKLSTYDEDSQSSVMSSTNDSTKMRKSKFADLFDSNKIWTAADVKEYMWPPPETPDVEHQVMMIQEQVAMFLGVKSFKRRYPELKRRPIAAEERDYVLSQGLVTEALCDLGITAVDASEVLDIMLSDYPHKYEEYRSHQRQKQLAEAAAKEAAAIAAAEKEPAPKIERVEMKPEPVKPVETKPETKPEVPKVDLEKARQEAMLAAIQSAAEFNSRMNLSRRGACVDLQTYTVHRRRAPVKPTVVGAVRPPAGFYPHALLPGQYQHTYRTYTAQQLRYFPLNTVMEAPPPAPSPATSDSDSEPDWGSSSSDDCARDVPQPKRKKLTKTKRSSQAEIKEEIKEEVKEEVELCRVCKLRLEGNRKHTHERFLVCSTCHCNLHPGCVELCADTIRRAREYPWQCAECKTCGYCNASTTGREDTLSCVLCDRAVHTACLPADATPPTNGRWHCVECSVCKSCGARSASGPAGAGGPPPDEATWHHHTKRGPGGHKVYSHSLCTPCARAYRIGRYCPLCERSFIGPKGTMQLVICKLCDRQHHQDCVKATGCALNVLDYTCGECRRGGITSRAAAARLAPRTIATLFMAKRRFNKYAHRQFLQSRRQNTDAVACDPKSDGSDNEPDASDPLDGAGDTLEAPSETLEGPTDTLEGPSDTLEGPSDTLEGPSDTLEGPSDTLEGPSDAAGEADEAAAAVAALRMDFT